MIAVPVFLLHLKSPTSWIDELDGQFERSDATDRADSMYGRKRHKVIHTPTGTVVAGGVNRQGSLGT